MEHIKIVGGPIRLLVCEPQVSGTGKSVGYGNLVRHIEEAVRVAAFLGLRLYLVRPARPLNEAVFDLESEQVRIIPQTHPVALLLHVLWRLGTPFRYGAPFRWVRSQCAAWLRPRVHAAIVMARRRRWTIVLDLLSGRDHELRLLAHTYADLMRTHWKDLFAQGRAEARRTGVKRELPRVRLRVSTENGVRELASAAGVDLEKPIVTLHVRESGFRRQPGFRQRSFDRLRDANIDTYRPAVDALVARGVQVIRIGDASMTPRDWPGMVDLATAPWRTDAFELWAVLRSWFFFTSDSGPYFLSRLARIPSLSVNVIQVGYYTKRAEDRYICKRVRDNALGRILTVSEMLTEEFVNFALNEERYSWIDNTSADILDALEDTMELMDADVKSRRSRTSAQRSHDALVANLAGRASNRRTRLGLQLGPLGRGTMAPRFAERYLEKGN